MNPSSQSPGHDKDELDVESAYLSTPVGNARVIGLKLGKEDQGSRKGTLSLDPNLGGLNEWGDRIWSTRMAIRSLEITTTRMRTLDPSDRKRVLHQVSSPELERQRFSLIEFGKEKLWYLVHSEEDGPTSVVPLFEVGLFEVDYGDGVSPG